MKLIHYRQKCIGCNVCTEHAQEFWEISKLDGKANLKLSKEVKKEVFIREINEIELIENELAERDCPMRIIRIEK